MSLPQIPEKYRDRVLTHDPNALLPSPDMDLAHSDSDYPLDKPVGITFGPDVVIAMSVGKTPVHEFIQMLLREFKSVGAPVEGSDAGFLKLHRGRVFKLKTQPGCMDTKYVWLPDAYIAALGISEKIGVV